MRILTPTTIEQTAWEGTLEPLGGVYRGGETPSARVTLGEPVHWSAAQAMENETGKQWTPPTDGRTYLLARLACNLYPPGGERAHYTDAALTVYLRPKQGGGAAVAHDLYPQRLAVDQAGKFTVALTPELKFAEQIDAKLLELGAEIEYHKAFPVIQGYGLGETRAEWRFAHHSAHPLIGCQSVYVVIAAPQGAQGVRVTIELSATLENRFGPIRLALPQTANANVSRVLDY